VRVVDSGKPPCSGWADFEIIPTEREASVAHRRAKLTPYGRLLLVNRIVEQGWRPAVAAESVGVSRACAYKWLRRWREEGLAGLEDRSSAPRSHPHALGPDEVARIVEARQRLRFGPHRLAYATGRHRSTVYGVLRRQGVSRLADFDRTSREVVRYQRERPGELVHVDVKKLGRIPDGGGHRMLGRQAGHRISGARVGYDYLHVAIDDATRVAFVRALGDERGPTCAAFLADAARFFGGLGITVERVLTDRAMNYRLSADFRKTIATLGIKHKLTRPYRPQTNGKAERFNRTLLEEWAYERLYASNAERLGTLATWVHAYNHDRPHTALGGLVPMAAVNNVCGNHS
jgi:transposase InsO family protein